MKTLHFLRSIFLALTICVLFMFSTSSTANAQCSSSHIRYEVVQPVSSGGQGSITFYSTNAGYYLVNTRDYGTYVKLFSGSTWPGTPSNYTFNSLSEGTYSFILMRPLTSPGNVDYPGLTDDYICHQFTIDIKATAPTPFTVTTANATSCTSSNGSVSVSGLPNISQYGVKFPTQSSFTQTFGAASMSGPSSLLPGNYTVEITTDVTNPAATKYTVPFVIASSSGLCTKSPSAFSVSSTPAANCSSSGTITVSGLPSINVYGVRFPTETSFTQTNGVSSMTSPSWYNIYPGNYEVEVIEDVNNLATARRYRLPVTVTASSGSCPFPFTVNTTNASDCSSTNGTITISGFPMWSTYGVLFPGQTTYTPLPGGSTSISSPAGLSLPPGTYNLSVTTNIYWSGAQTYSVLVTIGSNSGACSAPALSISGSNASNCDATDGTITVSGIPANSLYGVRFPGNPAYIQLPNSATSITSPTGSSLPPSTYNVIVTTNIYDASATTYTLPIVIGIPSGTCPSPVPSFTASTTNATNCTASDGTITVAGFLANQNYGVKFPGQNNFLLPQNGSSSITSPVGLPISAGQHKVLISRNVYNRFSIVDTITVIVNASSGSCIPPSPPGFQDDPNCSGSENIVFIENFGRSNTAPSPFATTTLPSGYVTDYTNVVPSCDAPVDGYYTIINTSDMAGFGCPGSYSNRIFGNIQQTTDHTGNMGGYFLFVNGSYNPSKVFEKTIGGLCPNTEYAFSLWIKNMAPYIWGNVYGFRPIAPALSFWINDAEADRDTLLQSTANEPAQSSWVRIGFRFTSDGTGSAKFTVRNSAPGGVGNDFAIDDIAVTKCVPNVKIWSNIGCSGNLLEMSATHTGGNILSPQYRWLRNNVPITSWSASIYNSTNSYGAGDVFKLQLAEQGATANNACWSESAPVSITSLGGGCFILPDAAFTIAATMNNNVPSIAWKFNDDLSVKEYIINKSNDGKTFSSIASITSINKQQHPYQYLDATAGSTNHELFYKVEAKLKNGKSLLSPIAMVKELSKNKNDVKVIPFIVSNNATVVVESNQPQAMKINIIDPLGKLLHQQEQKVANGNYSVQLNKVNELANGIYFVKVELGTHIFIKQILVKK